MEIEIFDKWNELKKEIHDKDTDNIYFKESEIWWASKENLRTGGTRFGDNKKEVR